MIDRLPAVPVLLRMCSGSFNSALDRLSMMCGGSDVMPDRCGELARGFAVMP